MSSFRRIAAGAALFILAMSAFAVPACEMDSSTQPRGGKPEIVRQTPAPSGLESGAQAPAAG
jgi:hypothetical protein